MKHLTKSRLKYTLPVLALVIVGMVFAPPFADFPRIFTDAEGRYGDIKAMDAAFDQQSYDKLPKHFECIRRDFPDGAWIQVISSDSHHELGGGGTTGVLESNGKRHFYFGHVCGSGVGIAIRIGRDRFDPEQTSEPGLIKVR